MTAVRGPAIKLSIFLVLVIGCLSLILSTLRGPATGAATEYDAIFTDVSGLVTGDSVRMAGVQVGRVTTIELTTDATARVRFTVGGDRPILDTTHAAVRYQTLLGQRYVELFDARPAGTRLSPGATIPRERTEPSFDVSRLFNGFKPLFSALDTGQLNRLGENLIRVLQGDGAGIGPVLADLDSLLRYAKNRDAVLVVLIRNLGEIAAEIGGKSEQVGALIKQVAGIIGVFSHRADELVNSLRVAGYGLEPDVGILAELESLFDDTHAPLHQLLRRLAPRTDQLVEILSLMPELLGGLNANYPANGPSPAFTCSTQSVEPPASEAPFSAINIWWCANETHYAPNSHRYFRGAPRIPLGFGGSRDRRGRHRGRRAGPADPRQRVRARRRIP